MRRGERAGRPIWWRKDWSFGWDREEGEAAPADSRNQSVRRERATSDKGLGRAGRGEAFGLFSRFTLSSSMASASMSSLPPDKSNRWCGAGRAGGGGGGGVGEEEKAGSAVEGSTKAR
ncbi:hypothetical protein IEQ34_005316 [Dendrobium chrysotoxum]|uniref:Uncharacterized protein n=1 Tax=Dendrobium chrysotoxum TaxID=161865 RepID=A0AAV7HCP5_DENCH|nr:hypothetical protein IEQ34_005316 [Dendrobium chrysotoxum]